jgi:hypothetical protein
MSRDIGHASAGHDVTQLNSTSVVRRKNSAKTWKRNFSSLNIFPHHVIFSIAFLKPCDISDKNIGL